MINFLNIQINLLTQLEHGIKFTWRQLQCSCDYFSQIYKTCGGFHVKIKPQLITFVRMFVQLCVDSVVEPFDVITRVCFGHKQNAWTGWSHNGANIFFSKSWLRAVDPDRIFGVVPDAFIGRIQVVDVVARLALSIQCHTVLAVQHDTVRVCGKYFS